MTIAAAHRDEQGRRSDLFIGVDPRIAVREWSGEDGTVVLLHGLGHNLEVWTPLVDHLPKTWRTVALDLRGHGKSGSSKHHRYDDYVSDVLLALDELAIGSAVVVGHSWGARVALAFAAGHAQRCNAVVALDQAVWNYEPPAHYLTSEAVDEPLATPTLTDEEASALREEARTWGAWAEVVERSLSRTANGWMQRPSPSDVRALTIAEAQAQPVEHLYDSVKCPIAFLFATDDEDFGFAPNIGRQLNVEHLAEVVPAARIEWIDGDHGFPIDSPHVVAAAIAAIVERTSA